MAYGEPKDVPNECNAHLYIGDNFGDNHATIRCQLETGHKGLHQEKFLRYNYTANKNSEVTITWEYDERLKNDQD